MHLRWPEPSHTFLLFASVELVCAERSLRWWSVEVLQTASMLCGVCLWTWLAALWVGKSSRAAVILSHLGILGWGTSRTPSRHLLLSMTSGAAGGVIMWTPRGFFKHLPMSDSVMVSTC